MESKKGLDLAAGRLTRLPGRRRDTRSGPPGKASSYGAERLGIVADAASQAADDRPAPREAAGERPDPGASRPEPPAPPAERPTVEETAPAGAPARATARWGQVASLWRHGRRPWVLAAAAGLAAVAVTCLLWVGGHDDAPVPRTLAQAVEAAPARPPSVPVAARPEAPAEVDPPRARPPAAADTRPAEAQHAEPEPPTESPMSTPASRKAAAEALKETMASWVAWAGAAARRARRQARLRAVAAGTAEVPHGPKNAARPPEKPAPRDGAGQGHGSGPAKAPPRAASRQYVPCPPGFRFAGAVRQPNGVFANINGRFIRLGGTLGQARLVKVGKSSVEMEQNGKRFVIGFGHSQAPPAPPARPVTAETDPPATDRGAEKEPDSDQGKQKD